MAGPAPVALVTGASAGIGLYTALGLARAGFRVMMAGRDSARLEEARRTVAKRSGSALTEPADQKPMNQALVRKLGEGLTLGEAAAQAKAAASDRDVRRSWILFGDPTTRLK